MTQHEVEITETVGVGASLSLTKTSRAIVKRHPIIFPVVLAIAILSPFLGLLVTGWIGLVVGLVISLGAFFLGLRAVERERHFNHYEA
jgi:hypothetical protein